MVATDRLANLALACESCNLKKGTQKIQHFLAHDQPRLARILAQAKAPLKDAAAVNTTRLELKRRLEATGLPLEIGSGGRTNQGCGILPRLKRQERKSAVLFVGERRHELLSLLSLRLSGANHLQKLTWAEALAIHQDAQAVDAR